MGKLNTNTYNTARKYISNNTERLYQDKARKSYLPGGPPMVQALWRIGHSRNFLVIAIDIKRHNVAKGC